MVYLAVPSVQGAEAALTAEVLKEAGAVPTGAILEVLTEAALKVMIPTEAVLKVLKEAVLKEMIPTEAVPTILKEAILSGAVLAVLKGAVPARAILAEAVLVVPTETALTEAVLAGLSIGRMLRACAIATAAGHAELVAAPSRGRWRRQYRLPTQRAGCSPCFALHSAPLPRPCRN